MKRIITIVAAVCGMVALGASSQIAKAPPGMDNIAAGYGAGFQSSGSNSDVICLGTDAGMNSANNSECIFIGKEAGKNVTGKYGYIDIGGKFKADGSRVSVGENLTVDADSVNVPTNISFNAGFGTFYGMNVFAGSGWNFYKDDTTDYPIFQYNRTSEKLSFWAYQEIYKTAYYHENANITFRDGSDNTKLEIQNFPNSGMVDFYAYGSCNIQFATDSGDINFFPGGKLNVNSASGMNLTLHNKKGAYLLYTEGSNQLEVYVDGTKKGMIQFTPVSQ